MVGPVGSSTANYIYNAKKYAAQAPLPYGAKVIRDLQAPTRRGPRSRPAAQGANLLIYLGHGNGYPQPVRRVQQVQAATGFGLNPDVGQRQLEREVLGRVLHRPLHPDGPERRRPQQPAVLRLGQLRVGRGPNPTKATAIKRIDYYGAGFLRAGAKVVFAEAIESLSYTIKALFKYDAGTVKQ